MIVSENTAPSLDAFRSLMKHTDLLLNDDAARRPKHYQGRNGTLLEDDVYEALNESAKGTDFHGTIFKISGSKFPDIVAAKMYGVEVKSTKDDHWTSTGSSILESTRVAGVERIYMTFGKLGGNIEFLSRPYEECLSGIAVTHMPRYLIDMRLKQGETIFDKMGIQYDSFRALDNPVTPVSKYYRSKLKPGESLWWAGDNAEESVSATIRLWKAVPVEEKRKYSIGGIARFPEVFGGNYDNYTLWLASQGIVDPHVRDQFSAGGQGDFYDQFGNKVRLPAVYRRVAAYAARLSPEIIKVSSASSHSSETKAIHDWCVAASACSAVDTDLSMYVLQTVLERHIR